ncbi:hypothetical protein GCM10022403_080920 [Streptomyces coacervatus]|uniref:Uncharacterized protein n=1 Tax=Streptomyces coacervatus TaxID=647381 RepID=A0ABP7J7Q2_9ACTN
MERHETALVEGWDGTGGWARDGTGGGVGRHWWVGARQRLWRGETALVGGRETALLDAGPGTSARPAFEDEAP